MTARLSGYYSAFVISKSTSDADNYRSLYEETVVLVRAGSKEEAEEKLQQIEDFSFKNRDGDTIEWKVIDVQDCKRVLDEKLQEVTEINSRMFYDWPSYRDFWSSL